MTNKSILREHDSDKCEHYNRKTKELCNKKAVYALVSFGEAVQYVGADGKWTDWIEDTEGYTAHYCEEHAERKWPMNVKQISEIVAEEIEENTP